MLSANTYKCFFILYLVGLSHGPVEVEEFVLIPLNFTHILSPHSAEIEFKFGDVDKGRVCHMKLNPSCDSVIDRCLCAQKSKFAAEVYIKYTTSVEFEKRSFRTIITDSNNTQIKGDWEHFPKINDQTCEETKEIPLPHLLGFGITIAVAIIVILVLIFFLIKRCRQVKILQNELKKLKCKDTKTGQQDDSEDVNKKYQKTLNFTDETKPESKDDDGENDRGEPTVMTPLTIDVDPRIYDIDVN